jgi:hypothetical protein
MARIRTIKPDFWTDSLMVQLDPLTRLLYIGMWSAADDHGALPDEPERLAMEVMPREDPWAVEARIDLLIACGRLSRMLCDDATSFLLIDKWLLHQRVDKPSKSRIIREPSRKFAIPAESRRQVALKYGCVPGEEKDASCYFCGKPGTIWWSRLNSGKPSSYVCFAGLELDHFISESEGGTGRAANLILSCSSCNRGRRDRSAFDFVTKILAADFTPTSTETREIDDRFREHSRMFLEGKGKGSGEGIGKGSGSGPFSNPESTQPYDLARARPNGEIKPQTSSPPASHTDEPRKLNGFVGMKDLENQCREAAGVEASEDPGLLTVGPIWDMIQAGWSLEAHILPKLREMKARGKVGRSWEYYAKTIRKGVDTRNGPPKVASPPIVTKTEYVPMTQWSHKSLMIVARFHLTDPDWRQWDRDGMIEPGKPGSVITQDMLDEARKTLDAEREARNRLNEKIAAEDAAENARIEANMAKAKAAKQAEAAARQEHLKQVAADLHAKGRAH